MPFVPSNNGGERSEGGTGSGGTDSGGTGGSSGGAGDQPAPPAPAPAPAIDEDPVDGVADGGPGGATYTAAAALVEAITALIGSGVLPETAYGANADDSDAGNVAHPRVDMQYWKMNGDGVPTDSGLYISICTGCVDTWQRQIEAFFNKICSLMSRFQTLGMPTPSPVGFVFGIKSPTAPDPQKVYFFRHIGGGEPDDDEVEALPWGTLIPETVVDA